MKNIPNMISQFIASSDESRKYSLTKNELKRLRVYLDEYDIQVDIIEGITGDERGKNGMDGKKESDKRTPINDVLKGTRDITLKKRETGGRRK